MKTETSAHRRSPQDERRSLIRLSFVVTTVSLLCVAIGAKLTAVDLRPQLQLNPKALLIGFLLALPMIALFLGLRRVTWKPIREVFDVVDVTLGPALAHCGILEMATLALGAGVSEELIFRGLLPAWLNSRGTLAVLILPNVLFGLLHAVTATYAWLAFWIGLYLSGSLLLVPNCNLVSVMVAHAVYDLVCFRLVGRSYRDRTALIA